MNLESNRNCHRRFMQPSVYLNKHNPSVVYSDDDRTLQAHSLEPTTRIIYGDRTRTCNWIPVTPIRIYIYIYIYVCVCVCVCVFAFSGAAINATNFTIILYIPTSAKFYALNIDICSNCINKRVFTLNSFAKLTWVLFLKSFKISVGFTETCRSTEKNLEDSRTKRTNRWSETVMFRSSKSDSPLRTQKSG